MNGELMQRLLEQMETYKTRINELAQQMQLIQLAISDNTRAKMTLEGCKKIKEGEEALVPVGSDFFVFAKIIDAKKVIGGIGHDAAVEKSFDEAIQDVDKKIKELEELNNRVIEEMQRVQIEGNILSERLQAMSAVMGGMPSMM